MATISGRSFIATLHSTTNGEQVYPVGYLRNRAMDGSGWLVQRASQHPALERTAVFRFDFIEEVGDRLHYSISAGPDTEYAGAKVGASRNGYLGFYSVAQVRDFWKIELTHEYDDGTFDFVLRDHRGYRVGCLTEPNGGFWTGVGVAAHASKAVRFLNVEEGDILHFRAHIHQDV